MKVPKYVLKNCGITTQRQFKALKRYQLKAILKALNDYCMGCAYCPEFDIGEIEKKLQELRKLLSVKNWGR